MKIRKCIIPAAGMGTRFLPATKAQPKEMLSIVDKPVIQYLVEEAVAAGIEDIIIVTSQTKRAIEDHFDSNFELEYRLEQKGKDKALATVKDISQMANIAYVRQTSPRGDGDALLRARSFIGDEPFLVLFGDDLIRGDVPASTQLIQEFSKRNAPIIGIEKVQDEQVSSYGILEAGSSHGLVHEAKNILEKPSADQTDSRLGIIGKYVLTSDVFDYLEKLNPGGDGEIRLADAFSDMLSEKTLYGLQLQGQRYDTGDKLGFLKATVDFALDNPELSDAFQDFLQTRVK
ncbi:MAG: UTP--glucose-1-phosphate uridylyltransferase GalU [Patescibacteria group bacterium]|nr:UTP--glucose-1-phosphate uridylyltransferase GalU [Patescibacteria group bacterium]